ncbi:Uncharacterized protein OBRU01_20207 [Operophtera brumata]|uniref:Nucleoporin Nup133/Nup155-like C-terminal domain-containing protein n=1 Tax=Operophtera brumata TaxID=104452 RepID=A0A0L7KSZ6_OPEBR|nr:Uncharacterized protein OBRU01_20207 [Operophtera brumata]
MEIYREGRKLVWECLSRNDELLHVAVYEWLVSKNLGSELLSLGASPPSSLRTYLQAAARAAPPPAALHLLDLLWKLYEEYADRYNLWECKLCIVQCAGHNDAILVETIWSNILAEAEAAGRALPSPDEVLASILSRVN